MSLRGHAQSRMKSGPGPALLKWGGQSQCNRCNRGGKGKAAMRRWEVGVGRGNLPPARSAEAQRIWHVYVAQKALHITFPHAWHGTTI